MISPSSSAPSRLLLGPLLRHVGATTATVWVQTDRPAEVEVLGCRAATFTVCANHYALVEVTGLVPGTARPYQVYVDGELAWPPAGSGQPESRIRTRGGGGPVRVVFGSCRHPEPDDPEWAARLGADSMLAYAVRLAARPPGEWPDAFLLLGDQVYADDPTPQTRRWLDSRRPAGALTPPHEVISFADYAHLYRESWSQPEIRWLLSTVPTAMIFDDHDVRDDWNTSQAWRAWVTAQPWWPECIRGALASYWVYQHIGNLSPEQRHADPSWRAVRAADGDGWPVLAEMAGTADADPASIRWSFRWDIDGVRLVMVDTRCGRMLDEGYRSMLDEEEWGWVEAAVGEGGAAHILIGSSVPWLLPPAISDVQSANEVASAGGSAAAERLRRAIDLEHWPAFRSSFDRLAALLHRVATGSDAPATISVLSGDVHHSYATRVSFTGETGETGQIGAPVHQVVCSPMHHSVPWIFRVLMRVGWYRPLATVIRWLVRRRGVPDPPLSWERVIGPYFGTTLATLVLTERDAELLIEAARRSGAGSALVEQARIELASGVGPVEGTGGRKVSSGAGVQWSRRVARLGRRAARHE
ncbi:MAG: alkaline phosphatase D family protein [Pseudonocardiaceae bacterium]